MNALAPILYVDDEPSSLVLFERMFEDAYDIRTALSAREALDILRRETIRLVITDQRMPGMTGVELLAVLYRDFPELMRLLTTAYSDIRTVIEAINQGHVWQYVAKPWEEAELKAIFARALENQALERRRQESIAELRAQVAREEEIRRSLQEYAPAAVADELLGSDDPEEVTAEAPENSAPEPILYVDDDAASRQSFALAFEDDCAVVTASSGPEALEILRRDAISLVITDQRMPGMTGVRLLETVVNEHPDSVRIILTGYLDIDAAIQAINTGRVYCHVTKPWDLKELRTTIDRALVSYEQHRRRRQLVEDLRQRAAREAALRQAFQPYAPSDVAAALVAQGEPHPG
ncbi:MAG: response regulator [bacterium]|nr:response regulator [bacterium]